MSTTTSVVEEVAVEPHESVYAGSDSLAKVKSGQNGSIRRLQATQGIFSMLPPYVLGLIIFLSWYTSTTYGHIPSLILPAPADVYAALVDGIQSGVLLINAVVTIQESVLGFLLATVVALPLGYGVAKSRLLANTFQPYLAAGQAIPAIVIAPFLYLWLGPGILSVMMICTLIVVFPIIINTVLGVQTIDCAYLDAARVEGASGWSLLLHIEFPLALPAILAAIRAAFTLSITGALVGEFVCSPDRGLGGLVQVALGQYNLSFLFAIVVVLAGLAALYYSATWLLVKVAAAIY
ncbi:MAG: ABC transporter permease [Ktedonobacteraceae bacterium]|nr:ABC transporter permease [Ktedonobacteraceae bacterium]